MPGVMPWSRPCSRRDDGDPNDLLYVSSSGLAGLLGIARPYLFEQFFRTGFFRTHSDLFALQLSLRPDSPGRARSQTAVASDVRRKEQLPELTKQIVETYTELDSINHLGHCPLPNYEAVVGVIEDLKEILFPGFRRREG